MSEAVRKHAWSQTAELLAMLFNGLFRPSSPAQAADFDPTRPLDDRPPVLGEVVMEAPISALKIFLPQ